MSRVARASMVAFLACALVRCSDNPASTTAEPLIIAVESGDGQTAVVGQPVGTPPAVKVKRGSASVSGMTVTFAVASGGGSVSGASAITDANGIARVGIWTMGTTAGAQTLTAQASGAQASGAQASPITFTATAIAGSAAVVTKQSGDQQSSAAGVAVGTRPSVKVVDQFGNAVAGVSVTFTVTSGGGTVTGATQATATDGVATVGGWTLGQSVGANTLTATVQASGVSGSPTVFAATAVAGAAASIAKQGGDTQSATVGAAVAQRPAVKVTDQFGNPVTGATVTFAVATGGGSVTGATSGTGVDGIAAVGAWTLGTVAGAQTLTATVTGAGITGNPVTFTATANAGAASAVVKVAGDALSSVVGAPVATRAAIKVTDQFGNAVSGVSVTFAVTVGTGTITSPQQTTGADGTATVGSWTIGQLVGTNVLRATAVGSGLTGNPADFTVNGVAGPLAAISKPSGDAQSVLAGSAVPIAPTVKLADQYGNASIGQTVNFAITGGGGAITGATTQTGSAGTATIGGWIFGATPGTNTLSATAGAMSVTFTGTALAALNAALYVGTYNGIWTNTTYGVYGASAVSFANNAATSTLTMTFSASGDAIGIPGGIPPTPFAIPYTPISGNFSGTVPLVGNITFKLASTATTGLLNITASGTGPFLNPDVVRWDATGTMTSTQFSLTFTVTYMTAPPAVGTILLTKP